MMVLMHTTTSRHTPFLGITKNFWHTHRATRKCSDKNKRRSAKKTNHEPIAKAGLHRLPYNPNSTCGAFAFTSRLLVHEQRRSPVSTSASQTKSPVSRAQEVV